MISTSAALLQKIEAFVLSAAILGIAALTIANVMSRSLLGVSLALAEELSQFLIIAVTFVGLGYAAGLHRHIRMTALTEQLPAAAWARWERIVCGATALAMLALAAYAARYVYAVYEMGGVYPVTRAPYYLVDSVAPLGFLLAGLQYAARAFGSATPPDIASPVTGTPAAGLAEAANDDPASPSNVAGGE
ncbi:TRAP transporter small permease [Pseudobythopirellula maris]|uniref:TRAP transporter small permease n=1 Tax=Pseudobythopirellula maris TaxID=2527991 RepID=UPI0018D306CC|nr:TRAP transporter small permease subunit [Pseudobythopirellula maris]